MRCVVVIDVLRATSTIAAALQHGCRAIIPVTEIAEAWQIAKTINHPFLLAGERKGIAIKEFDLGNSPADYTVERIKDKTIILTTSNGTRALKRCDNVARVKVGSFLNLQAVAQALILQDLNKTALLCAGSDNRPALEDSVCAGMLLQQVLRYKAVVTAKGCNAALKLAQKHGNDLRAMLHNAPHGRYLQSLGLGDDVKDCARLDSINRVPEYKYGRITAGHNLPTADPD